MMLTWLRGLLRRGGIALSATALGIAVTVAMLASLGAFLASSKATMTDRAVRGVAVDWQVEVQRQGNVHSVLDMVSKDSGLGKHAVVEFAHTSGLQAMTGGATNNTGPGVVMGLPAGYRKSFPGEIRTLTGTDTGVLLAQQTASNLQASVGSTIHIGRAGMPAVEVRVAGIVDLPNADSLFQKVGAPAGSQPSAPPDNVVLLPQDAWHRAFDPLARSRPDLVSTQIHIEHRFALPADPASAYSTVTSRAHNLEARTSGGALVGDNLGSTLDAARQDAAYAEVLFVFLGLPGAVLAVLLTAAVAASGAGRRRREQALLRARGATAGQLIRLAAVEAAAIGVTGSLVGLLGAALVGRLAFGSVRFGSTAGQQISWALGAGVCGLLVAAGTVLLPAQRDVRSLTVRDSRAVVGTSRSPRWLRWGLDLVLIGAGVATYLVTSRQGYNLVLAPEGVPSISVSYWAFAGPAFMWIGTGMLIWRLGDLGLGRGRAALTRLLRPVAGRLALPAVASISRQRRTLARSIVLLAIAVAFAISTATFNATYRKQAEVDARLTNGADVTVTESPGTVVHPQAAVRLRHVSGVHSVEPLQHRFAYVGADLQDLYGVRPASITHIGLLQNAYFSEGTATQLIDRLARRPDSILVSAETVKDFQLRPGDLVNLRIQNGQTKRFSKVPFHYAGIVKEFPTAPKDSFFVANAQYIAKTTGSDAVGAFLVDTGGHNTAAVATHIRSQVGTSAAVTDIATARKAVGSSLTAVDLAALTRVELAFALLLACAGGGLVLVLGFVERRRAFAIGAALGARARDLRAFMVTEALVLGLAGLAAGAAIGTLLAQMLVRVLTGVFDPPPDALTVPWFYLTGLVLATIAALALAVGIAGRLARRAPLAILREL